jgi:hypothetical protein
MERFPGTGEFYTDPVAMAFFRRAPDFEQAYRNACAYIRTLGLWDDTADIRWRFRPDPHLDNRIEGDSVGGAFFANLWHLLTGIPNDLSVTISAHLTADGRVHPVGDIDQKLQAIAKYPERFSQIIVAAGQPGLHRDRYPRLDIQEVHYAARKEPDRLLTSHH